MAASFGFGPPATKSSVESTYAELALARINLWQRLELRWPGKAPATSEAVAGVRASATYRYGAQTDELVAALACCGAAEHVAMLRREEC